MQTRHPEHAQDLTVRQLIDEAGLDIDVAELRRMVDAVVRLRSGVTVEIEVKQEFSAATRAALERLGADFSPLAEGRADPAARTRAMFIAILADSDPPERVAERLNRDVSRVRQRIREGTLWAIPTDTGARLPRLQFDDGGGEISGMGDVLRELPVELHPVARFRWLTTPVPDLEAPDTETVLSPRDWLRTGGRPETAIELARDLHIA